MTRAIERSWQIVELVAAHPAGVPHARVVSALALPKITVSRLLQQLCLQGVLHHDRHDRLYKPGRRLRQLQATPDPERRLLQACDDTLINLASETDAIAMLLRWSGIQMICIDVARPPGLAHPSLIGMEPGQVNMRPQQAPWGVFVLGADVWRDLLRDQPALRRWLTNERRRLREHGYTRHQAADRHRLASPLVDDGGTIFGALALVAAPERLPVARFAACGRLLHTAAQRMQMGL